MGGYWPLSIPAKHKWSLLILGVVPFEAGLFPRGLTTSWNRLANQTDRYVEFLKNPRNEK
jgi:hypothetical protein